MSQDGSDQHGETVLGPARVSLRGGFLLHRESGRRAKIGVDPIVVGRGAGCDLQLSDGEVSARHCELTATETGVRLRDLGSRNGTWFSDARIGDVHLTKAARIVVGNSPLEFTPGPTEQQEVPKTFGKLASVSPRMQLVFERLDRFVRTSENILLTGETGSGKNYIAQTIHERSGRRGRFVTINLPSLAPGVIESELFGHAQGAFTSARSKDSPFVLADGGTVFLDEVGELPLELQTKLLQVLDDKVVKRVGSTRQERVDVRIVAATLQNLPAMVNAKQFRVDLFERLGIIVELPPLRDRKEDLPLLVRQVLDDMGRVDLYAKVSGSTLAWMAQHSWEGNLRTLAKVVRLSVQLFDLEGHFDIEETYRIYRVSHEATSDEDWLESLLSKGVSLDSIHEEATRRVLARLASECKGNVSRIAERAQITRVRAREWLTRLNLRTSDSDPKR